MFLMVVGSRSLVVFGVMYVYLESLVVVNGGMLVCWRKL